MIGLVSRAARLLAGGTVESPVPLPPGVVLRESLLVTRIGGLLSGMGTAAAAVTLGRTILIHPAREPTERLVRHELAHVRQWEESPHAFPFRYIAAHIRHGYGGNPYEAEARSSEAGRSESGEGT